jgi:hypothetical protein
MKAILTTLAVLAITPFANAWLGDNPYGCYAQYGGPKDKPPPYNATRATFRKNGTTVRCKFKDKKCVFISHAKTKEKWTDEDIMRILKANGKEWTRHNTA